MSRDEPLFNIASVKKCTMALGPGARMAIWFQGCDIGCEGCCNPELQPLVPRHVVGLSELLDVAADSKESLDIEGVTLIGGEPTMQRSLPELTRGIRSLGLGIILFTGREFSELDPELVGNVDTVIDGRFVSTDRDYDRNLIGSRNQKIVNVTDRYSDSTWFTERRYDFVEVDLDGDEMVTNGSAF